MQISITRVTKTTAMGEHWRVLVVVDNEEIYHDSATSRHDAYMLVYKFLDRFLS
jgi:hypothetical protein